MAKALIGYLDSDLRIPSSLVAENHRLRMRVSELESLVLRLQQDNDRLVEDHAAALLELDARLDSPTQADLQEMQPV
jgi:hypothetical protein